jgi:ribosomal protein L11 methyltransferase
VTAIDIDPVAVALAAENVEINEVLDQVTVVEAQPRAFRGWSFDFVVANLTAETIIDIADDLASCLAPGGVLAVSGVLTGYSPDVESALVSEGLKVIETRARSEWVALIAKR